MDLVGATRDNWGQVRTTGGKWGHLEVFPLFPAWSGAGARDFPGVHQQHSGEFPIGTVWWGQPGQAIGCLGWWQGGWMLCRVGMVLLAPTSCRDCVEMKAM